MICSLFSDRKILGAKEELVNDLNEKAESIQRAGGANPIALLNLVDILAMDFGIHIFPLNPDYALGFVMRGFIARKSGCLETDA